MLPMKLLFSVIFIFFCVQRLPLALPAPPLRQNLSLENEFIPLAYNFDIISDFYVNPHGLFCVICLGTILFWLSFYVMHLVTFVTFDTNLDHVYRKKKTYLQTFNWGPLPLLLTLFFLCECPEYALIEYYNEIILLANAILKIALLYPRLISKSGSCLLVMTFFLESISPGTSLINIFVFQIWCLKCTKNVPKWLTLILIMLANDIERHPGPQFVNNCLSFMNWNLNSLAKGNFERIPLIEAHNTIFDYDIISICETSLNEGIDVPDPLLNDYTFISANHPDNVTHGGVGLFYKNSLPITHRDDLSFDESIVMELKFGRKKIFLTVLYRSPSYKYGSSEFDDFINNFRNMYSKIEAEGPYATFFTGDFNAHSQFWWPDGNTNAEGRGIESLFSSLNLTQIISEPTHYQPGKLPSCIDLIVTDQPNLVLESGTRLSLDPTCHHEIIYCMINFKIPPPPPYNRRIWHYDKANVSAIKRSMVIFPWVQQLGLNPDINWQSNFFLPKPC